MAYPWPGFGSFLFNADERPAHDDDTDWVVNITAAKNRALGALTDSITLLSLGSKTREFSVYLTSDRLVTLQALVGQTATFCDWKRPTPDSRQAFLESVQQDAVVMRTSNSRGLSTSDQRRKVRIALTSQ